MQQDLIRILSTLVSFRSTADNTQEIQKCFAYIKLELSLLPFTVEEITRNNHLSVIWRSAPTSQNHKKILLNAHLDVVPASDQMFILRQDSDRLMGRGVIDMKFGIACFIVALKQIFAKTQTIPPVDIIITSDEEIGGHDGAGYLAEVLPKLTDSYRLAFIPDGGDDWHIIEETKGALQLRAATSGKSAHGSRPWEGESAIDLLLKDLTALRIVFPENTEYSWGVTLNIGRVHAGAQVNQVSDQAFAELDVRFPADTDVEELHEQITTAMPHSTLHTLAQGAPLKIFREHPDIRRWQQLIADKVSGEIFIKETGATDGRYFAAKGLPVLLSKPVGGALHTEEEWLSLESFVEFAKRFRTFLES